MLINVFNCERLEFQAGKQVLYRILGSLSDSKDLVVDNSTCFAYSQHPLVPGKFYNCKLRVSNDMKSIRVAIGDEYIKK